MNNKKQITKKEIIDILKRNNKNICERFKVKEIGLFGSYVRREEKKRSDVDILVDFKPDGKTFDNYMDLKFFLEDRFGLKVDLVMKDALRKELKENILAETVYA